MGVGFCLASAASHWLDRNSESSSRRIENQRPDTKIVHESLFQSSKNYYSQVANNALQTERIKPPNIAAFVAMATALLLLPLVLEINWA